MSDKLTQARNYRAEGKTFKEIAVLVGCSEGYLRRELSGVPKLHPVQDAAIIKNRLQRISAELTALLETL